MTATDTTRPQLDTKPSLIGRLATAAGVAAFLTIAVSVAAQASHGAVDTQMASIYRGTTFVTLPTVEVVGQRMGSTMLGAAAAPAADPRCAGTPGKA